MSEQPTTTLKIGETAPHFEEIPSIGLDGKETKVSLKDLVGKNVVIYFYPKDDTSGCTKEGQRFTALKESFDKLNCVIYGVSADDIKSHLNFIKKFNFNFQLLADTNRLLITKYNASKNNGKGIQRSTVLINTKGKIVGLWNPVKNAGEHPDEVLKKLQEL